MKYHLIGNSPAMAMLAIELVQQSLDVRWNCTENRAEDIPHPLRPLRLRATTVARLRQLLIKNDHSPQFLAKAPELKGWSPASGALGGSVFLEKNQEGEGDRWFEANDLMVHLKSVAKAAGVGLEESARLPYPLPESETATVVDAGEEEMLAWPENLREEKAARTRIYVHELWFHRGRFDDAYLVQFAEIERVRLLLEPHPQEGFVLSLFSHSKSLLERILQGLREARGLGPFAWQALFLLNSGAHEHSFELNTGARHLEMSGRFQMAKSLGLYPPFGSFQDAEAFAQAERLLPVLLSLQKSGRVRANRTQSPLRTASERWNRRETTRFEAQYRQAQLWEFLVFSKRFQKSFLQVSARLPRGLRDLLKSPL